VKGTSKLSRTIIIAASLPAAPDTLFDMYLDAEAHAAFTGLPVFIEPRPGGAFHAFDGMLSGTILHLEAKILIVQTWRSANWPLTAMDSVLTISFWPAEDGARIELVHVNVPEEDFAGVSQGWEKYYWTPWRAYLTGKPDSPVKSRRNRQRRGT
jgi:activator of HSP90 ATPase